MMETCKPDPKLKPVRWIVPIGERLALTLRGQSLMDIRNRLLMQERFAHVPSSIQMAALGLESALFDNLYSGALVPREGEEGWASVFRLLNSIQKEEEK